MPIALKEDGRFIPQDTIGLDEIGLSHNVSNRFDHCGYFLLIYIFGKKFLTMYINKRYMTAYVNRRYLKTYINLRYMNVRTYAQSLIMKVISKIGEGL